MGYLYFNYQYLLFMLPAIALSMIAQIMVKSAFSRYSKVLNRRGLTGAMAAEQVLWANQVPGVRFEHIGGKLSDHFDPRKKIIALSDDVYNQATIAAVGVAAHEAGHAVQHHVGYWPIRLRSALVPVTQFGSQLATPLILIGFLLPVQYDFVIYLGIALYCLVVLFQLVTLPVEFNASARAIRALAEGNMLDEEELKGAKKVLRVAALTYLAAMFSALLSVLYWITIAGSRRDRS